MKKLATVIILSILMISGCTMIAQDNEITMDEKLGSKSEASNETVSNSDFAEDKERSFSEPHPSFDLYLELDLEDGTSYEIPRLSKEKEEEFIQANNFAESIRTRLESYGVLFNPYVMEEDRYFPDVGYSFSPMFISHFGDFDLLYVRYPGYRGTNSGNLYIFEKSMFKSAIFEIGEIDLTNCFRAIEENIWLVKTRHSGGSAMALEVREWINLTKDNIPVELIYTNYYGQGNFSHGLDVDFWVAMGYRTLDEELYINEQNMPILKVKWQKEVSINNQSYEEIFSMTVNGYNENKIGASVDWEGFNPYDLSCGNLLDGLEEQLNELIDNGTEEEQRIAKQLVEKFAAMSIY